MKNIVVGVDIGGTKTKVGLVDEGDCFIQTDFHTRGYADVRNYLKKLKSVIDGLIADSELEVNIQGIGIGAPNASYTRGTIEYAANLEWKGVVPLVEELKKLINVPIKITNDANAAALGEMKFGNAKNMKDFIVITLGTGLGSGIVSNGQMVYGYDGFAGELGHVSVIPDHSRYTGLGVKGGLEAYVSATGLKRTVMYMLSKHMTDSRFRDVSYNDLHGEEITKAAEEGDFIAQQSFLYTGEILGKALAGFVAFSQPEAIFLLGGLANSGKWIFEPTAKYLEENLLPFYKGKVKLLPSGMEEKNAAILGAASLIFAES